MQTYSNDIEIPCFQLSQAQLRRHMAGLKFPPTFQVFWIAAKNGLRVQSDHFLGLVPSIYQKDLFTYPQKITASWLKCESLFRRIPWAPLLPNSLFHSIDPFTTWDINKFSGYWKLFLNMFKEAMLCSSTLSFGLRYFLTSLLLSCMRVYYVSDQIAVTNEIFQVCRLKKLNWYIVFQASTESNVLRKQPHWFLYSLHYWWAIYKMSSKTD